MAERRIPQEPVALLLAGLLAPPVAPARTPPADAVPSHLEELDERLEALLVVADRPLDLAALATALDRPIAVVRQAVERLRDDYDGRAGTRRRGFELRELATGWRLFSRGDHDETVRALLDDESSGRLSQAALETLAVIAYRQPVTRGQIAAVRAVSVDSVLKTLVARGLVSEVGRTEESGAALYGTTDELLVALGIRGLHELPPLAPLLQGAEAAHDHV
jgi:segregation and condensation protein B